VTAFGHAAYFGIYGPLLGGAVSLGILTIAAFGTGEPADATSYLWFLPGLFLASIWVLPIALVVGIVPAIATGLTYWFLKARTGVAHMPALARTTIMSLVGGVTCVLFALCLGSAVPEVFSQEALVILVAPGMVAAALCTLLADRHVQRLSANT
jgi:Kef-type K+ transport system membrane component KefB